MNAFRSRKLTAPLVACLLLGLPAAARGSGNDMSLETIAGTIVEGGVVCPLLQLEDGEKVPLTGVRMGEHPAGTRLQLEGKFVQFSICQQGRRTFEVVRVLTDD